MMSLHFAMSVLLAAALIPLDAWGAEPGGRPLYKDPRAPIDRRVEDLLGRMTLEEKIAQLRGIWPPDPLAGPDHVFDPEKAKALIGQGICTIGPFRWPLEQEIPCRNAIQKYLLEKTRLGIPVVFHDEGCHGVSAPTATSFPVPIGLACSWDPDLVERIYTVVAAEMRARGSQYTLAPVVDICRDPRWGRTDETMGEDPYLNGVLGTAMVFGFQGRGGPEAIGAGHVAATLKHMTGHGQPEGGINRSPADVTLRQLFESHLVPFQMVLATAQPFAVMPSYNELDGVPSHANAWLLQDVLRRQFGFDGLIASDYDGIADLEIFHHVARDKAEAALRAFQAGVEVDLPNGVYYTQLKGLVEQGKIRVAEIDARVKKVLRLKFELGLFENPYVNERKAVAVTKLKSSKALAREAAQKSIVLLKNKDNILPLAKGKYKKIAVIGPNAQEAHLGSYPGIPWYAVSLLDGVKEKVGTSAEVLYAEGCKITTNPLPSSLAGWLEIKQQTFPTAAENKAAIAEAVQVAGQADLILLAIGENELICREAWPEHTGDRTALELFGAQGELARAMFALGKPVVVYLINGRPQAIPEIADKADAILEGWYMGQETGHAAADILFGDVNPSGKLTITFPRATGDLPVFYNHKPSAHNFVSLVGETTTRPLYPFGFGLSYTTFTIGGVHLAAPTIRQGEPTQVRATVANTGKRAGDVIVQLYIRDKVSSVARPVKELKGFQRIGLKAGQSREVTFDITPRDLSFYDLRMHYVVEPGEFEIMVGTSSEDVQGVTLNVTE